MKERPKHQTGRKTARLFKNGRSQAVRLPVEFRFEGTEVNIQRDPATGGVLLTEKHQASGSWEEFFRLRDAVGADELKGFMEDREQGVQERDDI